MELDGIMVSKISQTEKHRFLAQHRFELHGVHLSVDFFIVKCHRLVHTLKLYIICQLYLGRAGKKSCIRMFVYTLGKFWKDI